MGWRSISTALFLRTKVATLVTVSGVRCQKMVNDMFLNEIDDSNKFSGRVTSQRSAID